MQNELTIGIVTYNSADVITSCLKSIKDNYSNKFKILLVDNNSTDSTINNAKEVFPDIEIISKNQNLGFGYGVNQLMHKADTEFVLILNADVNIEPMSIEPLIDCMHSREDLIVSAPLTLDLQGNIEGNVRRFPSLQNQLFESFLGGAIAKKIGCSETVSISSEIEPSTVDWIKGAIWMINRKKFENVGGFRNDFFLYSEETEFAYRANKLGYEFLIVPASKAIHSGGESDTNQVLFALLHFNKIYYMKVTGRKLQSQILKFIIAIGLLLRIRKVQCRYTLKLLIKSALNFDSSRLKIIETLNGNIA